MSKKYIFINLGLMLSVLFAVSYQSIHTVKHKLDHDFGYTQTDSDKTLTHKISKKEDCTICDFKFASFLSSETFTFTFTPIYYNVLYAFSIPEKAIVFSGSLYALRAPPSII